jgi:membrane-bound metal-dependent hydrolase YbcI (DUF457 family)
MKTPSHFAIGWLLGQALYPGRPRQHRTVMVGATIPDLPLIIVYLYCLLQARLFPGSLPMSEAIRARMDSFYFGSDEFIFIHHLLHSPVAIGFIFLFAWLVSRRQLPGAGIIRAFGIGALSHSLIDLVTHGQDGLLFLWPLDWSWRFDAGVSQWSMDGAAFTILLVEGLTIALALSYWLYLRFRMFDISGSKRPQRIATAAPSDS